MQMPPAPKGKVVAVKGKMKKKKGKRPPPANAMYGGGF
jgi:hypothetical protein